MLYSNCHSHSTYCDGKAALEDFIRAAIQQGFVSYGCASHAPVPFDTHWTMKPEKLPEYLAELKRLKEQYQGQIEIYCGLEVDYIPGMSTPDSELIRSAGLDYTIGSIHYVDKDNEGMPWCIDDTSELFVKELQQIHGDNIRHVVQRFFELTREMLREHTPDVLAHIDKIKKHKDNYDCLYTEADWYRNEVEATLKEVRRKQVIVELNTRGFYRESIQEMYPAPWILKRMKEMDIPVTITTDAHCPQDMTRGVPEAIELLRETGFTHSLILLHGQWQETPLS